MLFSVSVVPLSLLSWEVALAVAKAVFRFSDHRILEDGLRIFFGSVVLSPPSVLVISEMSGEFVSPIVDSSK